MLKKEASNAIDEFNMRLKYKINPQSVILFGSQSQDIQTEDSDVDLIVLSNDFLNMDDKKRLDILYEASRFITPDIHPWGFTPKAGDTTQTSKSLHLCAPQRIREPKT